ncbi:hypothetical protein Bhyg_08850 [Pseudolycoriella hygida]|uniref:Uncharacterized protein n=1 Tax=Pseudolycoriella hygida TaxID=35572 RepID=A0A9Q0S577_9DIPT|nr:hypothetical protein Bhyg_08850 [Pseudolycoriella hygida]
MVLTISNIEYVLFGIIIFNPTFLESDTGHYSAAIRLNNRCPPTSSRLGCNDSKGSITVEEDEEDFMCFEHSDESLYRLYHPLKK